MRRTPSTSASPTGWRLRRCLATPRGAARGAGPTPEPCQKRYSRARSVDALWMVPLSRIDASSNVVTGAGCTGCCCRSLRTIGRRRAAPARRGPPRDSSRLLPARLLRCSFALFLSFPSRSASSSPFSTIHHGDRSAGRPGCTTTRTSQRPPPPRAPRPCSAIWSAALID